MNTCTAPIRVYDKGMTNTAAKLTKAQQSALDTLTRDGIIYAYNGISRATASALIERNLAKWGVYEVHTWMNRRSGCNHSQADWTLLPA